MYSKYVLSRDNRNYGIMGAPTGYLLMVDSVYMEICVGDVVHVPDGDNMTEHTDIVVICDDTIGVMGSASTPLSESRPDRIEVRWQDVIKQGGFQRVYPNGARGVVFTVKELKR